MYFLKNCKNTGHAGWKYVLTYYIYGNGQYCTGTIVIALSDVSKAEEEIYRNI